MGKKERDYVDGLSIHLTGLLQTITILPKRTKNSQRFSNKSKKRAHFTCAEPSQLHREMISNSPLSVCRFLRTKLYEK